MTISRRQALLLGTGAGASLAVPGAAYLLSDWLRQSHGVCFTDRADISADIKLIPRLGFTAEIEEFIAYAATRFDTLALLDHSHSNSLTRMTLAAKQSLQMLARHGFESLQVEVDPEDEIYAKLRAGSITRADFMKQYSHSPWLDRRLSHLEAEAWAAALQDKSLPMIYPVDARQSGEAKDRDFSDVDQGALGKVAAALEGLISALNRDAFINTLRFSCAGDWQKLGIHLDRTLAEIFSATEGLDEGAKKALFKAALLSAYDRIYGSDEETAKVIVTNSPPSRRDAPEGKTGTVVFYGAGHFDDHSRKIADEPNLLEYLQEAGRRVLPVGFFIDRTDRDDVYKGAAFIDALLDEETLTEARLNELKQKVETGEIRPTLWAVEFLVHPDKSEVIINDENLKRDFEAWRVRTGRAPAVPDGGRTPPAPDGPPR